MNTTQQQRPYGTGENAVQRSRTMRAIKATNTTPELVVRRLVSRLGYHYRLHRKDLPGKPDLALISLRKAIFVHGCFWHGHRCKRGARVPKSNVTYWVEKISRNVIRDRKQRRTLNSMGWQTIVIWECSLSDEERISKRISHFLAICSAK